MTETTPRLSPALKKLRMGIEGLDVITDGGLPAGRSTLITGTAGTGKTVLALQYLVAGARDHDQGGVLVTFEERPDDLVSNVESLGWDLGGLIEDNRVAIVDASTDPDDDPVEAGAFDLSALMARIEAAVRRVGAQRITLDAVGCLFPQFADRQKLRRELHRIISALSELGATTLITVERTQEEGGVGRMGVEEFVADNVIILRNRLECERRRRTIEILKLRGATHHKGEHAYTITCGQGVVVIPVSAIELRQRSSDVRVSSGVPELDEMCGGGLFRDSIVLASGGTGTGKTLLVTMFVRATQFAEERLLLFATEESREQLVRNASSWGVDFEQAESAGLLRVVCRYPEVMGLEDHLLDMKRHIEEFRPARIAVDSMSAYERVSTLKSFREFVIGLTSHLKQLAVTGLFTSTTSVFPSRESVTEAELATISDSIVLLRYVELQGEMRRGLTVLKMRGTWHEKDIREYMIDGSGMHVKEPFRGVSGILTGAPSYSYEDERRNLQSMFEAPR